MITQSIERSGPVTANSHDRPLVLPLHVKWVEGTGVEPHPRVVVEMRDWCTDNLRADYEIVRMTECITIRQSWKGTVQLRPALRITHSIRFRCVQDLILFRLRWTGE